MPYLSCFEGHRLLVVNRENEVQIARLNLWPLRLRPAFHTLSVDAFRILGKPTAAFEADAWKGEKRVWLMWNTMDVYMTKWEMASNDGTSVCALSKQTNKGRKTRQGNVENL